MSTAAPAAAAPAPWAFDAFVSYAHADANAAQALVLDLRARDVALWFDREQIAPGEVFTHRIERGLQQSRDMVQLLSAAALASPWMDEEKAYALTVVNARGQPGARRLIPVLLDDTPPAGLLASRLWIDLRDPARRGAELDRLARALRGQRPPAAAQAASASAPPRDEMAGQLLYLNRHVERLGVGLAHLRRVRLWSPLIGLLASAPLMLWLELQLAQQAASALAAAVVTSAVGLAYTWPRQAAVERDIARAKFLRDTLELCRGLPERLECRATDRLFWTLVGRGLPIDEGRAA